jgi:hypothetical protein
LELNTLKALQVYSTLRNFLEYSTIQSLNPPEPDIWKQVAGFSNYEVSQNGFVRNTKLKKILNGSKTKDGL